MGVYIYIYIYTYTYEHCQVRRLPSTSHISDTIPMIIGEAAAKNSTSLREHTSITQSTSTRRQRKRALSSCGCTEEGAAWALPSAKPLLK